MGKTPISDEELRRLYETHATAKIGEILGWIPEAIRKRLVKLGVKMRPRGSVRTFTPRGRSLKQSTKRTPCGRSLTSTASEKRSFGSG